ncbi:hypothetical protein RJ640_008046 [Escallonia rubra]|uniref:Nucleolar protein 14 n=1 Tax=Escallonia rubra TaxID=112253 RepID=A0AA88R842_9ASTE|nr:hypothetical protein RJ640_008046 [Escallonia rubra]
MGKKPNPSKNDDTKAKKKKNKGRSGPEAMRMKTKAPKPNPFETIWSRRKFDILGKKRKGEERRLGLARSIAIDKRKKTLLKDYEQSGKASVFVDKRIGEQNEGLGEFDKAILRSQREMQLKMSKKSKYNLSDGEEDELEIEGLGSFPERDDFEDDVPFEDYDDREATETEITNHLFCTERSAILKQLKANGSQHIMETGLVEGEENRQRSKKEVMEEIISKSKYFKVAQKAKDKEENVHLLEQLDKDFTSLVHSKALISLTQPNKMNALKALVNMSILSENATKDEVSSSQNNVSFQQEKPDAYDKLVNEMVLDMRARPSDRTKTPEEIAQEEKERLEELEEERQKRMLATDDSGDEDGDAFQDDNVSKRLRSVSGDDLGDSFAHDEGPSTKLGWIDEVLKREKANDVGSEGETSSENSESGEDDGDEEGTDDGTNEDNEEYESTQSLKDWEQSDDENIDADSEEEEEEGGEEDNGGVDIEIKPEGQKKELEIKKRQTVDEETKAKKPSTQRGELPFTIEAPKSLEELSLLLENRPDDQVVEAIKRIRTFNSITVAAENRKKMQVFYGVLLQYFSVSANKKPLNFKLLNLLVKPLMEMSAEIPYFAAICARQRLLRTRTQFCEDVKMSALKVSVAESFLYLWAGSLLCREKLLPFSEDTISLEALYDGKLEEIGKGSRCGKHQMITKQSRKFCPEAIMFLRTLLMAAMDKKPGPCSESQLYHLMELKVLRPLLRIRGCVNEIRPLDFLSLMALPEDCSYFNSDNFRASMLVAVVETLRGFVNVYEGLNSFPEMFLPIAKLLVELATADHMPVALQDKIRDVAQLIEKKADEYHMLRRPLQMRKQKPVPIKLLNPKFEENFVKGRDYDPDRERAEQRKIRKLVKREAKGAARELRKDNYFLSEVKASDKVRLEEERAEKYGKARAFLQEQEHAFKSGQLGKGRKRRRYSQLQTFRKLLPSVVHLSLDGT